MDGEHLDQGAFGFGEHLDRGAFNFGEHLVREHLDQGAFGPGSIWTREHLDWRAFGFGEHLDGEHLTGSIWIWTGPYFILQNKYLHIYKDSFGAKLLRDDCTLSFNTVTSLHFQLQ